MRETVEWDHGRVPGSINVPLSWLSERIGLSRVLAAVSGHDSQWAV